MNRERRPPLQDFMDDPDVGRMLAFQEGDREAFEHLVRSYTTNLLNFFYFQSGDRGIAEDCVQEVWAKLYRTSADYVPRARFSTFLYRVARNHWIDRYRSAQRRPSEFSLDRSADSSDNRTPLDRVSELSLLEEGSQRLEQEEIARILAQALAKLPEEMQQVYILAAVEERPYSEVADLLEIPVGTVKSRMFNAVRRLQDILRPILGEEL